MTAVVEMLVKLLELLKVSGLGRGDEIRERVIGDAGWVVRGYLASLPTETSVGKGVSEESSSASTLDWLPRTLEYFMVIIREWRGMESEKTCHDLAGANADVEAALHRDQSRQYLDMSPGDSIRERIRP